MEERKKAAIVLSVLLLISIIILYLRNKNEQTLSFRTCTVHVDNIRGLEVDSYRAARNELALCLCNAYIKKPDTAVANKIISTYHQYGSQSGQDSLTYNYNNLDSIIKNRRIVFDTVIVVD